MRDDFLAALLKGKARERFEVFLIPVAIYLKKPLCITLRPSVIVLVFSSRSLIHGLEIRSYSLFYGFLLLVLSSSSSSSFSSWFSFVLHGHRVSCASFVQASSAV